MPWYFSEERYEVEYTYIYIGNVALALGLQTFKRGIKKQVMDLRYQDSSETSSPHPDPVRRQNSHSLPSTQRVWKQQLPSSALPWVQGQAVLLCGHSVTLCCHHHTTWHHLTTAKAPRGPGR